MGNRGDSASKTFGGRGSPQSHITCRHCMNNSLNHNFDNINQQLRISNHDCYKFHSLSVTVRLAITHVFFVFAIFSQRIKAIVRVRFVL